MTAMIPLVAAEGALPFLAFADDAHSREILRVVAAARDWGGGAILPGNIGDAHAHVAAGAAPSRLVIDIANIEAPVQAVDALAEICSAGTRVLAIGTRNDVSLFRDLRRLGVADYLLKPLDGETLATALAAMDDVPAAMRAVPQMAQVIGFMGARGGAGTTAMALSVAHLLATRPHGRRVLLFDMDFQTGSSSLDIEAEVSPGLAAWMQTPDRLDQALVDAALRPHRTGFQLLSAHEPLDRSPALTAEAIQALLTAAGSSADYILVDMPRRLEVAERALIRLADRMAIVTPMTLAGLRDTQRLSAFITGLRAGQRPLVIANRVNETVGEVTPADFARALGAAPAAAIPYQPKYAGHAAERAQPLSAVAPAKSSMACALRHAAGRVAGISALARHRPSLLSGLVARLGIGNERA